MNVPAYWGFVSYSRQDGRWAKALHRRLEAYRIPRHVRPAPAPGIPSTARLRPVFLDTDELAASPDLGARLRDAIDGSRWFILLASPEATRSEWVNAEVQHRLDTRGADGILVVLLDGEPDVLPDALSRLGTEPLWVDARGSTGPSRTTVLRLVAGMLGVGFDALWQRDRRRRRVRVAAWTAAAAVLIGSVGTLVAYERAQREETRPERQIAAFTEYLTQDLLDGSDLAASDVNVEILRTDDVNGDGLLDFFVINKTKGFCGSGGCGLDVYLAEAVGRYRPVLQLLGSSTPITRSRAGQPYKEIVVTDYSVDNAPAYSVHRWSGAAYDLAHYEFCRNVNIEYCTEPVLITPVDHDSLKVRPGSAPRSDPDESAPTIRFDDTINDPLTVSVIGEIDGGAWYLVNVWKGVAGFVAARDIVRASP